MDTEYLSHAFINANRRGSVRSGAERARFKRHRFISPDGNQTYHLSIIDFLQMWNFKKRAEQFVKVHFLRANKNLLSAVEPQFYKARFQRFMRSQVFIQTNLVSKTYLQHQIFRQESGLITSTYQSSAGSYFN